MNKTGIILILTLVAGSAFAAAFFMPKTFSDEQVRERNRKQAAEEFLKELKSIKTEVPPQTAVASDRWEEVLSSGGSQAVPACDSLVLLWDRAMFPQVSAYFFGKKAELLNDADTWTQAGKRFLAVSAFAGDGNRGWAVENAEYAFEKALAIDPRNRSAKIKLAATIVEKGTEPMKGIGMLREVVAEDPANTEAIMELGRFAMVSGQFDKAIGHFTEVTRIDTTISEARFYLADAYAASGKKDSALTQLNLYLQKVPADVVAQQAKEYMKSTYGIENK